jgi:hypothetical protein
MVSEEYPKLFSYEAYLSDLYFEEDELITRGFEEAYQAFLDEKQLAFAVYKAQVEEEKEYFKRQYEALRSDREIKDNRLHVCGAEEDYESRKNSVLEHLDQQKRPVLDALGKRWIRCEFCGEVKEEAEFVSFGGRNRVNLGRCLCCKEE